MVRAVRIPENLLSEDQQSLAFNYKLGEVQEDDKNNGDSEVLNPSGK